MAQARHVTEGERIRRCLLRKGREMGRGKGRGIWAGEGAAQDISVNLPTRCRRHPRKCEVFRHLWPLNGQIRKR